MSQEIVASEFVSADDNALERHGWRLSVQPRAWQEEALVSWKSSQCVGIVSVVTGAGKTLFAQLCMLDFHRRYEHGRHVILVPTLALLDQWYVALTEDLAVAESEIATYSGRGRSVRPGRVNLLVLNTARDVAPTLVPGQPAMLVVDESHRSLSPMNSLALHGAYAARLGLSATQRIV